MESIAATSVLVDVAHLVALARFATVEDTESRISSREPDSRSVLG